MSHVVVAPDKFKGTLTAAEVAVHAGHSVLRVIDPETPPEPAVLPPDGPRGRLTTVSADGTGLAFLPAGCAVGVIAVAAALVPARGAAAAGRRGSEPAQVGDGVVVEEERPAERLDHSLRRVLVASLLEPHVVVRADAREHRHLLAAQSGDAAAAAPQVRQADLLGADELAAGAQVLADRILAAAQRGAGVR